MGIVAETTYCLIVYFCECYLWCCMWHWATVHLIEIENMWRGRVGINTKVSNLCCTTWDGIECIWHFFLPDSGKGWLCFWQYVCIFIWSSYLLNHSTDYDKNGVFGFVVTARVIGYIVFRILYVKIIYLFIRFDSTVYLVVNEVSVLLWV